MHSNRLNLKAKIFTLGEWYSCRGLALVANSGEGIVALYAAPYPFLLNTICLNQTVDYQLWGLTKHHIRAKSRAPIFLEGPLSFEMGAMVAIKHFRGELNPGVTNYSAEVWCSVGQ